MEGGRREDGIGRLLLYAHCPCVWRQRQEEGREGGKEGGKERAHKK